MKLIVGLGNPGKRYAWTRHNFGELVVRQLARKQGWQLKADQRFQASLAQGRLHAEPLLLCVPTSYMNESGRPVRAVMEFYNCPTEALLVVCDDIALEFGRLRLKPAGSAGGHNGLKSIEEQIGSQQYARLRLGIGGALKSERQQELADYVLDPFSGQEMEVLPALLDAAGAILEDLIQHPIHKVMERVNRKLGE